ncbi:hypothetical protein [Streptosporangium sp. NPDC023615]|uniref:hypothetical protein n=1 Tax=Streptosporangium sp. NPDC023615 TaxID=3154794 RepID=UPI003430B494
MRTLIGSLVIALGCLLAPLALLAGWSTSQVADPGGYLRTMAPLAGHPAVRQAVTDHVADEVVLRLRDLGVPARGELVRDTVEAGTGDDFAAVWVEINRMAHRRFLTVVGGAGGSHPVVRSEGVGYDLAPMYELARQRLRHAGVEAATRLPDTHPTARVIPPSAANGAHHACKGLTSLRWVLAGASPLLIAAGVFLVRDRRVGLIGAGLGTALSMLALAIALSALRNVYLPESTPRDGLRVGAVLAMFDTLTASLRSGLRVLFGVGLAVAAAMFLAGNGFTRPDRASAASAAPMTSATPAPPGTSAEAAEASEASEASSDFGTPVTSGEAPADPGPAASSAPAGSSASSAAHGSVPHQPAAPEKDVAEGR